MQLAAIYLDVRIIKSVVICRQGWKNHDIICPVLPLSKKAHLTTIQ